MDGTDHLMVGWTETAWTPILTWDSWEGVGRGREGEGARHTSHIELGAGASSDRQARPHTGRKEGRSYQNECGQAPNGSSMTQQLARWLWGLTNER